MTTLPHPPTYFSLHHGLSELRTSWLWFVVLGGVLIVLGFVALGAIVAASLATVMVIGCLMLFSGIAETIGAFWSWRWSGFFLHLLSGVLSIVVGLMFLRVPIGALLTLTLLLACLLMVGGVFKIIASLSFRFSAWGWPLLSGIIDLILGVMIWQQWPASALWVIGMFLGINLVFRGFNWIGLGLALRTHVRPTPAT